jgi:plastocyanin
MRRKPFAAIVVIAATALAFAGAASSRSSSTPRLKGTVGPGFTISLKKAGRTVTTLKPGSYAFVIADKSSIHNFTLEQERGGKFEKHLTSTPFTGTKTVSVKLRRGKWKFYCSVHESQMFGFFRVR